MDKQYSAKEFFGAIFLAVTFIAFMESTGWRDFLLHLFEYGAGLEIFFLFLSSFKK